MIPQIRCMSHSDEEIILLDISEFPKRRNRAYCLECLNRIRLEKTCQIKKVPEKFREFCTEVSKEINIQYDFWLSKISQTIKHLNSMKETFLNIFQPIVGQAEEQYKEFTQKMQIEKAYFETFTAEITGTKLEQIAEMLSGVYKRQSKIPELQENSNVLYNSISMSLNQIIITTSNVIDELEKLFSQKQVCRQELEEQIEQMKQSMKKMNQKIQEDAQVEQQNRIDRDLQIEKLQQELQKSKQEQRCLSIELEQNKKIIKFLEDNFKKIIRSQNFSAIDSVVNDYVQMHARYQQEGKQEDLCQKGKEQQLNYRETEFQIKEENKVGAFEALVKKLPDPSKFTQDPNIELMDSEFEVFRVEIKQLSFDLNFHQIYNLKVPQDYTVQKESQWNCVRTKNPFAFGSYKAVYLMKKKESVNSNEVYVLKMPFDYKTYSSLNEALKQCRSHLISQKLMQKFISELKAAPNPENLKIPEIRYSNLFILKENNNSFWIAERFFNGQFLKYNNNNGYINSEQSDLNIVAQTFTFYTYEIGDFNYIISDVQGVGANFSDPAINTTTGQFDETDMGQEGIENYVGSFDASKNKYMKYLKMLNLDQNLTQNQ